MTVVWEVWLPVGGAPAPTPVAARPPARAHAVKISVTAAVP